MATSTPPSHVTRSLSAVGAALLTAAGLWLATVRAANAQCVGDCDGDGTVAINELILGVNIALGRQPRAAVRRSRTRRGWWTSRSSSRA